MGCYIFYESYAQQTRPSSQLLNSGKAMSYLMPKTFHLTKKYLPTYLSVYVLAQAYLVTCARTAQKNTGTQLFQILFFCPCLLDNCLSYQYISLGCRIEQNTDYFGNDIVDGFVETQQACADKCYLTPGGLFWTWDPKIKLCYIKSSDYGRRNYPGTVSGNRECGSGRKIYLREVLLCEYASGFLLWLIPIFL